MRLTAYKNGLTHTSGQALQARPVGGEDPTLAQDFGQQPSGRSAAAVHESRHARDFVFC
jgi:hypothetical protein